jgi:hypothetical protein
MNETLNSPLPVVRGRNHAASPSENLPTYGRAQGCAASVGQACAKATANNRSQNNAERGPVPDHEHGGDEFQRHTWVEGRCISFPSAVGIDASGAMGGCGQPDDQQHYSVEQRHEPILPCSGANSTLDRSHQPATPYVATH